MPHLPDDDGYEPPLKVLRKRFNGVYREDHGFSGPTRRYLLMVAMLVGLASLPTLAVITAGTSEIAGNRHDRALDAPFRPPPASSRVRPSNHSRYGDPGRPPSDSGARPAQPPGVSRPDRTGDRPSGANRVPTVPGLPRVPDDVPSPPRPRPDTITVFPTVPGLPPVPDDWEIPPAGPARFELSAVDEPDISDDDDPGGWRGDTSAGQSATPRTKSAKPPSVPPSPTGPAAGPSPAGGQR
ncbi:hypothetical protein [Actinoplanes siamensis]|uniref:Uncharacterized protein n=1 Tax=Actinoplanes siamensis TaxID=1223317 RepID=A0A919TNM0_9ACTN|nr:hypothetical protein [Actinoplanes siamensis]GIF08065.1 hypothetical protein Asi03nite_56030 [Actinoplanes siamensis]